LSALTFAAGFILAAIGFFDSMTRREFETASNIISIIVSLIYTLGFWINAQATPGKMAFGAKIVDAKTLGEPSVGQYIGRYLAYILSAIPLGLGFIWVAFDEKKRGWHDMLAGTLVIKRN
ncbi:MAG: RDD family protein, partial [Helicobacteraceae bacterium]|nr:RDD family protein [Helicobacteraceae bacterium]